MTRREEDFAEVRRRIEEIVATEGTIRLTDQARYAPYDPEEGTRPFYLDDKSSQHP